ncbi:MAG: 50S ribosomal protein L9 [Bacteroidales bacterium]|nr:50S ribosomal protein L9 [Bacteroidales bacterium]
MKIILKENVAGLGYKDDVVEVKDGYGRNYLIPQGKCIIASDAALKQLKEDLKQRAHKIAQAKADAEAAAKAIEGLKLTIAAKTGANGTVYGSVGAAQIAEALAKLGHDIDRKIISVKQPVKVVGVYVANVKFHKEVETEVEFEVVSEDAPVAEAPAAESAE